MDTRCFEGNTFDDVDCFDDRVVKILIVDKEQWIVLNTYREKGSHVFSEM